ncbi:UNVERIFIED_ORG: hypothetical protein GGE64_003116 [Rhizobium etli]|jgi:hypothetical protein
MLYIVRNINFEQILPKMQRERVFPVGRNFFRIAYPPIFGRVFKRPAGPGG